GPNRNEGAPYAVVMGPSMRRSAFPVAVLWLRDGGDDLPIRLTLRLSAKLDWLHLAGLPRGRANSPPCRACGRLKGTGMEDNFEKYAVAVIIVFGAVIIGGLMAAAVSWRDRDAFLFALGAA